MNRRLMFTVALLAVLLCAGAAGATTTRINSMGGGLKTLTVLDDRNIFLLPAELVKYGNWSALELGSGTVYDPEEGEFSTDFTSFAIHYNLNPDTVIGLMGSNVRRPGIDEGLFPSVLQGPAFANQGLDGPNHRGTLLFAKGDANQRFGGRFGIYGQTNETTDYDADPDVVTTQGPFAFDFGLGAGFAMGSGDVDVGLGLLTSKAQDESSVQDAGSDNTQTAFNAIVRGTFPAGGNDSWVPFIGFETISASGQDNAPDSPEIKGSATSFTVGTDLRIQVTNDIFLQPGIGVMFGSIKQEAEVGDTNFEDKVSSNTLPFFNLAAEFALWDWLDFRFGGAQYVNFVTEEDTEDGENVGEKDSYTMISHVLATGIGVNLPSDFHIDVQVHTDWWRNGPYLLTGSEQTFGLNAALSKDW